MTVAHTTPYVSLASPVSAVRDWPGTTPPVDAEQFADDMLAWQRWLREVTLHSPLDGLKLALGTTLHHELSFEPDSDRPPGIEWEEAALASLHTWRTLAAPPPDMVRALMCRLLIASGEDLPEFVTSILAPEWWVRLEGPFRQTEWVDSEAFAQFAREEPALALRIGVAAALLHEINEDLICWGADLLNWWSTQSPRCAPQHEPAP